MQVKISARHGQLHEGTQKLIQEKAERLLHHFNRVTLIDVTVDLQDDLNKSVEVRVDAEHKHDFVAVERNADLVAAVDAAMAKVDGQLRRYKEKIQDHRRDQSAGELAGPAPA